MPHAALQAQIRLATFAAHRAVTQLDARALEDLQALYTQAAREIAARIAAHAGADGGLAMAEMRSALVQVEQILQNLGRARDGLLDVSLARAATLGVEPLQGVLDAGARLRIPQTAVRFVRDYVAADGLRLSDRIWRLDRGARDRVVNAVEQAVIQGYGADRAAREFLNRGEGIPIEVQQQRRVANAAAIGKETTRQLLTGSGSAMDNAMRVFRTEINRAHGEAYMAGGEAVEGFAGWRYLLSPAHPEPDICDLLSAQNLYGLGPGVYPTRETLPWPAHPNTLSFVVMVFEDEITAADRAGKETPIEALGRLTPAQRKGVLGAGKLEIYEQGKLRQGMIRTPLRAVRQRVGDAAPPRPVRLPPVRPAAPRTLDEMIGAGERKVDALLKTLPGGIAQGNLAAALIEDLRGQRGTLREAKVASAGAGADLVRQASRLFPDDWTVIADRLGPLTAKLLDGRAYYRGFPNGAGVIATRDLQASVHEYSHRLQHALPALDAYFQDLHGRRTEGAPLRELRQLIPKVGYGRHEVAREDKYITPYQGRVYSKGSFLGKHGALEVMTMAFETLLGGNLAQLRLMLERDREMINLAVGLLYHYVP